MSCSLDVADLESRVRRRLAGTQRLPPPQGASGSKSGAACARGAAAFRCSERRLPSDGGPPLPRAAVDVRVIARACDGIALFWTLHPDDRARLYQSMYQLEYRPGEAVVRQGEEGRNFYVLVDGYLTVTVEKEPEKDENANPPVNTAHSGLSATNTTRTRSTTASSAASGTATFAAVTQTRSLSPGDTFGEVALLQATPRSATVRAADGPAKVWALDRSTFKSVLQTAAFQRRETYEQLLASVAILEGLGAYGRGVLADALAPCSFRAGEIVVSPNQRVVSPDQHRFHIIERGAVSVRLPHSGREVNRLGPGRYFGEISMLEKIAPTAEVVALEETRTVSLDRDAFRRVLGEDVLREMAAYARGYLHDDDPVAETQGAIAGPAMRDARTKLNLAFEVNLIRRAADPSGTRARCSEAMLEGARRDEDRGFGSVEWRESGTGRSTIEANDLSFHEELGVGMSGRVYLAKVRRTNAVCCVKVMRKKSIVALGQAANVARERELMTAFRECPFVMQSRCAFQDAGRLFLVMDFMAGGDLFQLLVNGTPRGTLSPSAARFYAAEVFLALEFLHDRGFVYRDLKPENVLIGADGHAKLADLGFCKPLKPGERTYTTCGTSDYMAPEVMLSRGYDRGADFWAFGVFVYELLAGQAPFAAKTESRRHKRILTADLKFKADFHLQAKDLVRKLCVVDVSGRFGMMRRGADDVKDHAFWRGHGWDDAAARNVAVPKHPETPKVKDGLKLCGGREVRGMFEGEEGEEGEGEVTEEEDKLFEGYF